MDGFGNTACKGGRRLCCDCGQGPRHGLRLRKGRNHPRLDVRKGLRWGLQDRPILHDWCGRSLRGWWWRGSRSQLGLEVFRLLPGSSQRGLASDHVRFCQADLILKLA